VRPADFFPFATDLEWHCERCARPVLISEGVAVWVEGKLAGVVHDGDCPGED